MYNGSFESILGVILNFKKSSKFHSDLNRTTIIQSNNIIANRKHTFAITTQNFASNKNLTVYAATTN